LVSAGSEFPFSIVFDCFENEPELAETLAPSFILNVEKQSDENGKLPIKEFLKILRKSSTIHSDHDSESNTNVYSEQLSFNNLCNSVDMKIKSKDFKDSKSEEEDIVDDLINSHIESIISESSVERDTCEVKSKKKATNKLKQHRGLRRKSSVIHLGSISKENSHLEVEKGIRDKTVHIINTTTSSSNTTTGFSIINSAREYNEEVLNSKKSKTILNGNSEPAETKQKTLRKMNDLEKPENIPEESSRENNEILSYPISRESVSDVKNKKEMTKPFCFCF
jgi:hypothetical protein